MMQPKRLKYRKPHRTKYDGKAKGNKYVERLSVITRKDK